MRLFWMPVYIAESAVSVCKENGGIDPADPPAWMVEAGAKAHWDTDRYSPGKVGEGETDFKAWEDVCQTMALAEICDEYRHEARAILVAALSASEVRDSTDAQREQRR